MSNSIKSVKAILNDTAPVSTFLSDADKYYAHISPKNLGNPKNPETLEAHIELVQEKFAKICEVHKLDGVIDKLILDFVAAQTDISTSEQVKVNNFVKKLWVNTIVFHDFGKINENFQAHPEKMNNPHFKEVENSLSTHHSSLGGYFYITKHLQEVLNEFGNLPKVQSILLPTVFALSYSIFRHHAKYLADKEKMKNKLCFSKDELLSMQSYILKYNFQIDKRFSQTFFENNQQTVGKKNVIIQFEKLEKCLEHFSFYSLTRLSFSLLTASDYLASGEYMSGIEVTDFGVLSRERIAQIFENVQKEKDYNITTYEKLEGYQLQRPQAKSSENLNILRQEMAIEVIQNVRKNKYNNLFYIEAPTGGGKTNLAMLATAELLQSNEDLNKVYYVFPFTTLVTQTHKSIIETLGLEADEVVQLHSKAGFPTKEEKKAVFIAKEEDKDGFYSTEKQNYLDRLFVNYPFCLMTHIKFFDILKSNEKENNYLLSRLANSVVVIDELQSYNPAHWDKIIYWIRNYAYFYNIKFILMSATLPKIDKLRLAKDNSVDFINLLKNPKVDYFQNPNFAERVTFNFDLLEKKDLDLVFLANILVEKSRQYAEIDLSDDKPKGSVYTIVEFIFKKAASEFYEKVKGEFFDEIFVLSGTVLEHRRKYIINYLKNEDNRKKKVLLITTQVVEAGVDIDMDLGFKNTSLIDSDEQLAGRINRNVKKSACELYIFKFNEPSVLYAKDRRYEMTKQHLSKEDYQNILITKDFDRLYNLVLDFTQKYNATDTLHNKLVPFGLYEQLIKDLNFKDVNESFRLIEQANLSVFVPLDIPTKVAGIVQGSQDEIFSKNELTFLAKAGIVAQNDKISGKSVFDLYMDLVENKRKDFIAQKVGMQTLQGIISKFIFSLFDDAGGRTRKKLISFSDIGKAKRQIVMQENDGTTYGYIYLSHYSNVYDENTGLDDTKFDASENFIL